LRFAVSVSGHGEQRGDVAVEPRQPLSRWAVAPPPGAPARPPSGGGAGHLRLRTRILVLPRQRTAWSRASTSAVPSQAGVAAPQTGRASRAPSAAPTAATARRHPSHRRRRSSRRTIPACGSRGRGC
jgi:hypothetical protein